MEALFPRLADLAPVIYLALALGALFSGRALWASWRNWREAHYGLEREIEMRQIAKWIASFVLILALACAELSITTFVLPQLPASAVVSTPTVDLLAPPQAPGSDSLGMAGTLTPVATAPGSEGCIAGVLDITSPRPGQEVSGTVDIVGTVNVRGLGFYKYELSVPGSDIWSTVYADRAARKNESLGSLKTAAVTPGDYLLRLVATDNEGRALTPCVISIRIKG